MPRVDERTHSLVGQGQAQRGFAHQAETEVRRGHEFGALGAIGEVLPGGVDALDAVAVQQAVGSLALQHPGQFPGQVAGVVQARVQAAHAEDRHQVGGVAGEQHAAVAVAVQRQAFGVVDGDPQRLPGRGLADHVQMALHARQHVFGLDGLFGVFVIADLVVHPPYIAGLPVHEQGGAGVGWRIEPGQAFHRAAGFLFDVDDDVASFVLHAFQLQAHGFAHGAAAAVAGDQPVGAHGLAAAVGIHLDRDAAGVRAQAGKPRRPAQRSQVRMPLHGLMGVFLDRVLLDVDHGRIALQRVLRHLEVQDFAVPEVAAAAAPGQAGGGQRAVGADPAHDFLRAPRNADGAAAAAIVVVGFQRQGGDAVFGQQGGQRQADGAAAGYEDGDMRGERHAVSWSIGCVRNYIPGRLCAQPYLEGEKKPAGSGRVFSAARPVSCARSRCAWPVAFARRPARAGPRPWRRSRRAASTDPARSRSGPRSGPGPRA
ncbi:hypothetical protein LMG26858_06232 [Achromobacter anxifer]|uniref:Uncharacterized protein n=1 Tax=Achromobacter anxifer TaxID=1287737 RepID=A0A6S7F2L5_9BURK|nr:hypothetical protein LMG26858_06232 [Achromobacter anxifer]